MTGNHRLVDEVRTWVRERSPQSHHLERTLAWVIELEPDAPENVQIAALSHDMERAFPDGSPRWEANRGWQDPLYDTAHAERSARFVGDFLRDHSAPESLVREVVQLILAHESGGWPDVDVIQAADSLSFLETMGRPVATWVLDGRATEQQARDRLEYAARRIRHRRASEIAAGMLPKAIEEFEARLVAGA
jgi:hypothetical protein